MKRVKELLRTYESLEKSNESFVLATIVEIQGSHYSPIGTCMLITAVGDTVGNISSGCLRADVIERAHSVMRNDKPELVTFDTTTENDLLLGSGMGCGGKVSILLEPAKSKNVRKHIETLAKCEKTRSCTAVATVYATEGDSGFSIGDRFVYDDDMIVTGNQSSHNIQSLINTDLADVFSSAISMNKTYMMSNGKARLFIEYLRPSISIILFGGNDDVVPVCNLADILGWHVTVVDPRPELLTHERFPQARELITAHPIDPKCFESIECYDAAIVMTHNFLRDLELLGHLLSSNLKYIGLLGATKRVDKLLAELDSDGADMSDAQLKRLYAPVGLDIGAESPAEIALSIVAEIQKVLCGGTSESLRGKRSRHHDNLALQPSRLLSKESST